MHPLAVMAFRLGAVLAASGVGLGAFGAHGLAARLGQLGTAATFETAARYHMYHALALVALAALPIWEGNGRAVYMLAAFGFGVLIFSGTLYTLALTGIKWLGAITPIGGVFLIAGWVLAALSVLPVLKK
jgi:uncharacterized membrane protein YgdD (TMEM256/DUF423 family)